MDNYANIACGIIIWSCMTSHHNYYACQHMLGHVISVCKARKRESERWCMVLLGLWIHKLGLWELKQREREHLKEVSFCNSTWMRNHANFIQKLHGLYVHIFGYWHFKHYYCGEVYLYIVSCTFYIVPKLRHFANSCYTVLYLARYYVIAKVYKVLYMWYSPSLSCRAHVHNVYYHTVPEGQNIQLLRAKNMIIVSMRTMG